MSFGGFGGFGTTSQTASQPPKPSTNIFGASPASAPGAQQTASTSSPFSGFGVAQQQQPQAGSSNNAFGTAPSASNTTPATGSIFGAQRGAPAINVSNPNGSTTTPLFPLGGTASTLAPPAANTSSTFSLFPPPSGAAPAGGALNTSTSSPFGSFGQSQVHAGPSTFKPFGSSAAAGFGGSTSATGASSQPASNLGAFGSSGTSALNPGLVQSTSPNPNPNTLEAQIRVVEAAIAPELPSNRFQYYFYNLVDADQIHLYGRPSNATNEALWQRAIRENPNPSRLVPALAVGFDDLKKRADAQQSQIDGQIAAVRLLRREVDKLSTKHTLTILPLALKLSHSHAQLAARLTALIHHLHLFIPSLRGASLRPEEEALRAKLEALEEDVRGRSDALGRAGGRTAELWGVVGRVKAQKEAGLLHGTGERGGWAVVDPAAFEEIKAILVSEQQGLKFLTDVLRTALRDIDLVRSGFGLSSSISAP